MIRALPLQVLLLTLLAGSLGRAAWAAEELPYERVDVRMGFEIRRYPAHVVAETRVRGAFDDVSREGFNLLNDYISGNNRRNEKVAAPVTQESEPQGEKAKGERIEMTPPTLQTRSEEGPEGTYVLAFVMPPKYTLDTLPHPADSRITLRQVPAQLIAAHRYSGRWDEGNYARHEAILLDSIKLAKLKAIGKPMYARYDPPIKPWFMRRNEVLVEIADPAR